MRKTRQEGHPVNDWMVSSLRSNLVVKPVTGFGNSNNAVTPSTVRLRSFPAASSYRLHFAIEKITLETYIKPSRCIRKLFKLFPRILKLIALSQIHAAILSLLYLPFFFYI